MKNVPGRKSGVPDCQRLQELRTFGLLSGAVRPDAEVRRLRSYLRQYAMLVRCAAYRISPRTEIQRSLVPAIAK